ncbi:STAS domain-containing protein [Actinosynnema sp. NPDC053489]|uniref:STAS domain-containing protein n=1 Tax=Actinosynnema sp. NPDC053489 TaxID=3363916 RepID=UPI0037C8D1E7
MIDLTTTTDGATHTMALAGELDHDTTPRLREELSGLSLAAGDVLVLDLSGLEFCDSSGLSALLSAHELASGADAALNLRNPPRMLVKMLHMTGLAEIFTVQDTDRGDLTG